MITIKNRAQFIFFTLIVLSAYSVNTYAAFQEENSFEYSCTVGLNEQAKNEIFNLYKTYKIKKLRIASGSNLATTTTHTNTVILYMAANDVAKANAYFGNGSSGYGAEIKAGILHEIGHAVHDDARKIGKHKKTQLSTFYLAKTMAFTPYAFDKTDTIKSLIAAIKKVDISPLKHARIRNCEYRADAFAAKHLVKSNDKRDIAVLREQVRFFKSITWADSKDWSKQMMKNHPLNADRAKFFAKKADQLERRLGKA